MTDASLTALRAHMEATYPITDSDWEKIAPVFELQTLKKGAVLMTEGDRVQQDYWVVQGCLKASFTDAEGKEFILQFATEGWWISDYNALFRGQTARIHIDCLEDAVMLILPQTKRLKLYEEVPAFESFFIRKLSNGYVALQNRILSILTMNPKERYEEFLSLYPNVYERVPKKYIAQYLGVSRETLSRLYG